MRTVHVMRGPAEKTPVQIRDNAHLTELVQRFGQESVVDADTGQPAQPEAAPEPEAAKARSKAKPKHAAKKSGSKKRK